MLLFKLFVTEKRRCCCTFALFLWEKSVNRTLTLREHPVAAGSGCFIRHMIRLGSF